jgi:hypothetical protein
MSLAWRFEFAVNGCVLACSRVVIRSFMARAIGLFVVIMPESSRGQKGRQEGVQSEVKARAKVRQTHGHCRHLPLRYLDLRALVS